MTKPFATIPALTLSHYILAAVPASHYKLQKLVYYVEGWHLAYFERSLVPEEFEAWVHGPAIRTLWNHYRGRGGYTTEFCLPGDYVEKIRDYCSRTLRQEQIELVNDVITEYGDKTAYHLEALSHSELPWREARNGYSRSERSEALISKETMKRYYQSLFPK